MALEDIRSENMNPQEMREWISKASYETLLRKWRYAPVGDSFFQDDIGDFYSKTMEAKRAILSTQGRTRISKAIGWERE
jgi:hypothetical protein